MIYEAVLRPSHDTLKNYKYFSLSWPTISDCMQCPQHVSLKGKYKKRRRVKEVPSPEGGCIKGFHVGDEAGKARIHLTHGDVGRVAALQRPALQGNDRLQIRAARRFRPEPAWAALLLGACNRQ